MSKKTLSEDEQEHQNCIQFADFKDLPKIWEEAIRKSRANNKFLLNQPFLEAKGTSKKTPDYERSDNSVDWKPMGKPIGGQNLL